MKKNGGDHEKFKIGFSDPVRIDNCTTFRTRKN